jgi:hypothetical protein
VVDLGKQHIRGDWIRYVPKKTIKAPRDVQKPLLPLSSPDHRL